MGMLYESTEKDKNGIIIQHVTSSCKNTDDAGFFMFGTLGAGATLACGRWMRSSVFFKVWTQGLQSVEALGQGWMRVVVGREERVVVEGGEVLHVEFDQGST